MMTEGRKEEAEANIYYTVTEPRAEAKREKAEGNNQTNELQVASRSDVVACLS